MADIRPVDYDGRNLAAEHPSGHLVAVQRLGRACLLDCKPGHQLARGVDFAGVRHYTRASRLPAVLDFDGAGRRRFHSRRLFDAG